ncbi:hypothetical protein CT0861_08348 [Colletotrichum tofieldiae]|uniref:Uncharacterized protein n=1 Tax=Colletotrichum tofieldiae TaxID=708197 RepID=A0A166WW74_9PEZI|nr:hypothetical protein CT0861_08348 [Colletotrichum tofieldiae]
MTEMGFDENEIYNFLDWHQYAKRSGSNPSAYQATQRGLGSGQGQDLSEDDELFEFFFDWNLYAQDPTDNSGPPLIMADGAPLSIHDSGSTTETSSIRTPETLLSNPESPLTDYGPPEEYEETLVPAGINELTNPHDPFLFPRLDQKPNPPRKQNLQVHKKKRSRSNSPNGHKRIVKDPLRTSQVRTSGSCTRCRIQKVTCTPGGTCDKCIKAYPEVSESSCIRKDFIGIALDLSSARFAGLDKEDELRAKDSFRFVQSQFYESIHKGHVVFNRGQPDVKLSTVLQNYCRMSEDGQQTLYQGCVLAREYNGVPSYDDLVRWGESMVFPEDKDTFEGLVELFIKDYSAPCRSRGSPAPKRPQMELLNDIHKMKVMYKICCEEGFGFIRENTSGVKPLPLLAKAELRAIARMALVSFEGNALRALDKYLGPKKIPDHEVPAVWASLWQLLFIYRDLLRIRAPPNSNAAPLLNAVAVFYSSHFRTSASLDLSLDKIRGFWDPCETQQAALADTFDHALRLRDTFHRTIAAGIAAGVDGIDHRLKALVVDPEIKVLKRRQTSKKSANGK